MRQDDPRLALAQAIPIAEVADRLGIAGLKGRGPDMAGPCPVCGGRDRFSVHKAKGVFNCRQCGGSGDGIALVRHVLGCDFRAALDYLCGAEVRADPEVLRRRRAEAEERRRKQEAYEAKARARAIDQARAIWRATIPADGTAIEGYLAGRGIDPRSLTGRIPPVLRFVALHPYRKQLQAGQGPKVLFEGPAMIAIVQGPDGRGSAVHQTWIDPGHPGRKAVIEVDGEVQPAKLVRGSKKGAAIRLWTPEGTDALVMGEGIETTMTALVAQAVPGAAYWAGVDLGNMAGRRLLGPGLKYAGIPDMEDRDAFVPPPWVRRLYLIQDGDSDAQLTRAKLLSGARRAMRLVPGLVARIVHAGEGRDLNDIVQPVQDPGDAALREGADT